MNRRYDLFYHIPIGAASMSVETRTISAEDPISLISCDVLPPIHKPPEDPDPAQVLNDHETIMPSAPEGPHR